MRIYLGSSADQLFEGFPDRYFFLWKRGEVLTIAFVEHHEPVIGIKQREPLINVLHCIEQLGFSELFRFRLPENFLI